jgi:Ribonucleases G and E
MKKAATSSHHREDATSEELAGDVAYLRKTWATILRKVSACRHQPAVSGSESRATVLRDFVNDETSRIQVDSRETYQMLPTFAAEFTPAVSSKLHHYTASGLSSICTTSRRKSSARCHAGSI